MVLPHFDEHLEKYANLLIKKGVNIQKGQTLLITIAVEHHKLARLLTKKAYEAGAAEVFVDYNDDQITREKLLKADEDRLLQVPDYVVEQSHYLLDQKASRLVIRSANPNVFADVDSDRLAGATRATAHVDFMIGSEQMDIDGITKDGEVIPIFRGGEWAI
ncbi:TPA: aminopeptidase [Streptococcus equi subsp. zooepidemicus]|nr:aminopeptidase [Streptococcus equi subsp. zooepidemicus]